MTDCAITHPIIARTARDPKRFRRTFRTVRITLRDMIGGSSTAKCVPTADRYVAVANCRAGTSHESARRAPLVTASSASYSVAGCQTGSELS
jgi:hypothetical protein